MAIKNYTTKVGADQSIREIQKCLVDHGAVGFMLEYEKGTGRIESLQFALEVDGQTLSFKMPTNWRAFQRVLKEQGISRANDDAYCYRVAWRCVRDWVLAQMALYETQMVSVPQVFLPYAVTKNGKTLFETLADNPNNLLGE